MKRKWPRGWFALYTAGFLGLAALICAIFYIDGKSFFYYPDGYVQTYTAFEFVSSTVRGLFSGAEIPMIDFSLGQGFDALTSLSYYGVTDPVNLIAAFGTGASLEYLFALTTLLRLYLAGIFFALCCREAGIKSNWAIACGALMYAFSGYSLYAVFKHSIFGNGVLYLPLMLLGAEWALKNRRVYPFALFTALMLITNFYFAYINTLLVIMYAILRLIFIARSDGAKTGARGFAVTGRIFVGLGAFGDSVFAGCVRVSGKQPAVRRDN